MAPKVPICIPRHATRRKRRTRLPSPVPRSDLELARVERVDVGAGGLAVEQHLGHEAAGGGAVLDAPAGVAGGDPQAGGLGAADEGRALLAEAHVAREVARLLGLDGRGGELRRDGADVGDEVVALRLVALHLVGRLGEGDRLVGLAWEVSAAGCGSSEDRRHVCIK